MSLVKFDNNDRTHDKNSSTMLDITSLNCMKTFGKGSCLTANYFDTKTCFVPCCPELRWPCSVFLWDREDPRPSLPSWMQALGWTFGEVHICGPNNRKQDKTEALLSPSENLGGWHFPIDMSPTRVEISLGTNSIMTQKTENTINEKMTNWENYG